jgi:hypothetical protein
VERSLSAVLNQQIHGSKRSLRSIEDFTQFEQRTAYFLSPSHATILGGPRRGRSREAHRYAPCTALRPPDIITPAIRWSDRS